MSGDLGALLQSGKGWDGSVARAHKALLRARCKTLLNLAVGGAGRHALPPDADAVAFRQVFSFVYTDSFQMRVSDDHLDEARPRAL